MMVDGHVVVVLFLEVLKEPGEVRQKSTDHSLFFPSLSPAVSSTPPQRPPSSSSGMVCHSP